MDKLNQLRRQKKYRAASNLLRKMLEQAPENDYLLALMANDLWDDCKNEEALQYADRAKKFCPTDPYVIYTRARVLWALDKDEEAIAEWDNILNMSEHDLKKSGYRPIWIKTFVNEARYYKALSLRALFRDKEAFALMEEHLKHRGKGIRSDFTKKEATLFYKELKYSYLNSDVDYSDEGYATRPQAHRIGRRMEALEDAKQWDKLVRYLKGVCKRYHREYYYKTLVSEYCIKAKNKADCLKYAEKAFAQETNDPLVKYTYAVALKYCGRNEDALAQFEGLVALGLDYIAYSEHGEGMRWAKKILRHTQRYIDDIKQGKELGRG